MMEASNLLWYIRATHLIVPLLVGVGIILRWNKSSKALRVLIFLFFMIVAFRVMDMVIVAFYSMHPLMLSELGNGMAYSFGSLYSAMSIGTFAYIYSRSIFCPMKNMWRCVVKTNSILIVSILCYMLFSVLGYSPERGYGYKEFVDNMWSNPFILLWVFTFVSYVVFTSYISIISLRWMLIHRRNIKNNFSVIGDFRYYYVYFTYISFCMLFALGIWLRCADITYGIRACAGMLFTAILVSIYIFATLQQDIYTEDKPMIDVDREKADDEDMPIAGGDRRVSLNDRRLVERLHVLVDEEKIYTLNDLTAETLASKMGVSRKKLYLFLKEHYEMTFLDYINGCRLNHAAMLLKSSDVYKKSILEISEEAGFNTISTFNKLFKAKYNATPAQYRDVSE